MDAEQPNGTSRFVVRIIELADDSPEPVTSTPLAKSRSRC